MEQTIKWHSYPQEKPQKSGRSLITRNREVDFDIWKTGTVETKKYGRWEVNYWDFGGIITAWAEIPEPYKEEVEE